MTNGLTRGVDGGARGGPAPAGPGESWAIVLAAGGGTRFGGPKQFADLAGRPMLEHTVRTASAACDGIVAVLPAALLDRWTAPAGVVVVAGGATRAQSVRAGLAAVPAQVAVIVVTDAAHPLATAALYRRVVDTILGGADAAVPGLPLSEVVKEITISETATAGTVVSAGRSLPRETHRLIQMPHAFAASRLRDAHAGAAEAVEDSEMVAAAGARVIVVEGEPANIHVTTPEDLALANLLAPTVLPIGAADADSVLTRAASKSDDHGAGGVHASRMTSARRRAGPQV
jgi:2-C-methyl-D-erythritol 4-phosphate cytidylyltransferase